MKQMKLIENGASRLLRDINVHFNIDAPDPERILFEVFQPHYAKFRYLALADALVEAYKCLNSTNAKQKVMQDAFEALARCANRPLGVTRSLAIVDFAYAVAPENFEQDLWRRLFFRYDGLEAMPRWSGALLLRWTSWNEYVGFTPRERKRIVEVVEPSRFECAVSYLFKNEAAQNKEPNGIELKSLQVAAMSRLHRFSQPFLDDEIDTSRLEEVLYQLCDEVDVFPDGSEDADRLAVKANLANAWGESETMIGFGYRVDDEYELAELAL